METMVVDANVIIRLFTGDHAGHLAKAKGLFSRAQAGEVHLVVPLFIAAEAVFTLRSFYKLDRRAIAEKMRLLGGAPGVTIENVELFDDALERFTAKNVDFPDALLVAFTAQRGMRPASFDRDFDKFDGIDRYEPEE